MRITSKVCVSVLLVVIGFVSGRNYKIGKQVELSSNRQDAEKYFSLFLLMNQWVRIKQKNRSITEYFVAKGYKHIAIYGMNYVGKTLLTELENSEVCVEYGIDQNADQICCDIEIINPEQEMRDVDLLVITPIYYYNDIAQKLSSKVKCPMVSIEDILYDMQQSFS